jgi:hypothetical protein
LENMKRSASQEVSPAAKRVDDLSSSDFCLAEDAEVKTALVCESHKQTHLKNICLKNLLLRGQRCPWVKIRPEEAVFRVDWLAAECLQQQLEDVICDAETLGELKKQDDVPDNHYYNDKQNGVAQHPLENGQHCPNQRNDRCHRGDYFAYYNYCYRFCRIDSLNQTETHDHKQRLLMPGNIEGGNQRYVEFDTHKHISKQRAHR